MGWERVASWVRQLVAAAMKAHAVPRHIAFIMDGNRRYAEKRHLHKIEGHRYGYQKLIDALEWCLELGVECVSVYAFSIDNYKRSQQEVALLMELAEQKLATMLEEQDVLVRHGVQVRVIGDLSLAPASVQQAAAKVMDATRHHTKAVLNICFSYTSSQEMLQALDRAALGAACSCGSGFLDEHLYTQGCPPIDLLIRTSGETRLSDFLLWQCRHALLVFTHVLWPDFGFLDLLSALVLYQRSKPALDRARRSAEAAIQSAEGGSLAAAAAAAAVAVPAAATGALHNEAETAAAAAAGKGALLLVSSPAGLAQQQAGGGDLGLEQLQLQQLAGLRQRLPVHTDGECLALVAPPLQRGALPLLSVPSPAGATAPGVEGGSGMPTFGPSSGNDVAVLRVQHLGGDSPCAGASPRAPSSPSHLASPLLSPGMHASGSELALASPLPPSTAAAAGGGRWPGLRPSPSSTSVHSLGAAGGAASSSPRQSSSKGGLSSLRSPLMGSVDSFSSIDLGADGSNGAQVANGALQRRRLSYQDLLDAT